MEKLKQKLSGDYDLPGIKPNYKIQLGIPKEHPNNPFYPGNYTYHYSCSFEDYQKLEPGGDPDDHWDYRGIPMENWSYSLNPHVDACMVRWLGLCLPKFQRNFKTVLENKISLEIFDDLQPMAYAIKRA